MHQIQARASAANAEGLLVADVLDAWVAQSLDTWAPSSARDQESRVRSIKKDQIARLALARLSIGDVERWHSRMRRAGMGDAGIKNLHGVPHAALAHVVRWGYVKHERRHPGATAFDQDATEHCHVAGGGTRRDGAASLIDPAAGWAGESCCGKWSGNQSPAKSQDCYLATPDSVLDFDDDQTFAALRFVTVDLPDSNAHTLKLRVHRVTTERDSQPSATLDVRQGTDDRELDLAGLALVPIDGAACSVRLSFADGG